MVRKALISILLAVTLGFGQSAYGWRIFPSLGGSRSGTAALTFLKIGVGARGAGLAGAYSATCTDAFALYHNPAGLVWNEKDNVAFSYRFWVADLNHSFIGITRHLNDNNVLGISLITLTTDPLPVTDEYHPTGTGETIDFSDFALGISYSVKLTDYFSSGLTFKYAQESLGDLRMRGGLIDLGTLYETGFYGTRFAINMANFGDRVKPGGSYKYTTVSGEIIDKSYQSSSPPTVFKVSAAFEPISDGQNTLTWVTQLNHPTDNAENIAVGLEYTFNKRLFLRSGYLINSKVENFSIGGGFSFDLKVAEGIFDYSYTGMDDLGGTSTFSVVLGF